MLHLSDDDVSRLVSPEAARAVLRDAFLEFGSNHAAVQRRERTESAGVKLSTLGAVIPSQGVVGAKVYTTIQGQFGFVVILFSAESGLPLATLDAGALTRIRTAACSVLAAQACVHEPPRVLGLFGLGVQGTEHAVQMAQAFPLQQILVHDPHSADRAVVDLEARTGVSVRRAAPEDIAASAGLLVTATRSKCALFSGDLLQDDAFVAAIGSSLPSTRELDDRALQRARQIIVEWKPQTLSEAGDLVLASPDVDLGRKLIELSQLLARPEAPEQRHGIYIYKAVGIGLADIALAGLAYRAMHA
ncbi:MAG TPA: ornithine cyclodeaminase family protein [Castellaniella sp.]|uniref:ornithine cyclodeaminase family protein n=1 Tax=Castellaniella sp. TaxID=1955812 RepID=UPI002F213B37